MAKAIMIQGTMSNVGKSILAAGLCRIFKQDGYKTAPFKSQNMALNSYITLEGLEMGRAQVVQAEAAGILPVADMNPILLKPTTDVGSQVIVHGISRGNMKAKDYFAMKKSLIPEIMASYERLSREYEILVIEGAGSPAEINLKAEDIVNMGLAKMVDAPVLLVGDIDRGGVFAQLYGTVALLEQAERERIKGLVINKFRGDGTILEPGIGMLEKLCQIPVAGVVPFMDVDIEDEDSLSTRLEECPGPGLLDLAVIRFPRISNFTDFHAFSRIPGVSLRYVSRVQELGTPDMIFLPGTKSTMEDLLWMRQNGLEAGVIKLWDRQVPVWGICGGYQMMGERLRDAAAVESGLPCQIRGMGLLPLWTEFQEEKVRTQVEGVFGELEGVFKPLSGAGLMGYEIHMGRSGLCKETQAPGTAGQAGRQMGTEIGRPMAYLMEMQEKARPENGGQKNREPESGEKPGKADGLNRGNTYGTYVHGIFDGPGIVETMIACLAEGKGLSMETVQTADYASYKQQQYDKLADTVRSSLDMKAVYRMMGL